MATVHELLTRLPSAFSCCAVLCLCRRYGKAKARSFTKADIGRRLNSQGPVAPGERRLPDDFRAFLKACLQVGCG
jgi:hypothetical protein